MCNIKIKQALAERCYETVRRLALREIEQGSTSFDLYVDLHAAYRKLEDFVGARTTLESASATTPDEAFTLAILLAEDYYALTNDGLYRGSEESKAGLSLDEYIAKYRALSNEALAKAKDLIVTDAHRLKFEKIEAICGVNPLLVTKASVEFPELSDSGDGVIRGQVTDREGKPAANIRLVLGLEVACLERDPSSYAEPGLNYQPEIGPLRSRETVTDAEGCFEFAGLPEGKHEFIAACLDPLQDDLGVHFLVHDIVLTQAQELELDLQLEKWVSAEPEPYKSQLADSLVIGGVQCRLVQSQSLKNPFYFNFPRQVIELDLSAELAEAPDRLRVICSDAPDEFLDFQVDDSKISFFAELPAHCDRIYGVYVAEGDVPYAPQDGVKVVVNDDGTAITLDTGCASYRLPWEAGATASAPILAVRGQDNLWRGKGRWVLPDGLAITGRTSRIRSQGPISVTIEQRYILSDEQVLIYELTAQQGESLLQVREISAAAEGVAFEFSLAEFSGGRGFLHWTANPGNVHWSSLIAENRELARLQESVAWWIPPEGFAYAMTKDSLDEQDYIGVMSLRRGEWIDRDFEKICRGPGDNRELDWPFPEMVGSTISMITAHTDTNGDAWYRFNAFDGERQWGLLVSRFDRNDGIYKEISSVQHKNSSPRLQEFKDWHLDEQDTIQRPSVITSRDKLIRLRQKENKACFKELRQKVAAWEEPTKKYQSYVPAGMNPKYSRALDSMLKADPVQIWALKKEIAGMADIRSRMTLLGRDYSDIYSPVGARPITPWAEVFDLIVATGAFTVAEERRTRTCLMLMGHMYMQADLMNWQYGSRNANFEADRVDVVGTIGLVFRGGRDSQLMLDHGIGLMKSSLEAYCTPGSGKWYENPAHYYLHATNCRLNLAFHLWDQGLYDVSEIPRMKDYLSWALHIVTAPFAEKLETLIGPLGEAEYESIDKVRLLPPIGDHADLGGCYSEYLALMAKVYKKSDPEFARKLLWLYQSGGRDGGIFARHALLYVHAEEEDMKPVTPPALDSRRLEGFGAVLRHNAHQEDEAYCLFKLGPGGYRYHRTEGSIILIENGKPLIFDGGEAGETWRHTTLSFGETHMPLAPGHVERFASTELCDFVQGVNPKALQPGEPVFLSDCCEHQLVEVAHERFNEPNPANCRSLLHVKGDYYILHDQLNLSENQLTHWHIQPVADEHEMIGPLNYRFRGRFGTDLQVLLPSQEFDRELVRQDAILDYERTPEDTFSMRHLQLSATAPKQFLAVIRPLHTGDEPLKAQMQPTANGGCIVTVSGPGVDDWHCFDRNGVSIKSDGIQFKGRYGSIIRRDNAVFCILHDGDKLTNCEVVS